MVLIFLLSLAPVLAAVLVYFNPQWRPEGSVNYGQLVEPQRPMPVAADLQLTTLDGKPFDLNSLKGKWLLVAADGAACPDSCARKLFILRNSHASQGKNVERLARVWFITDDAPVPEKVLEAYKGTTMVRVKPEQLQKYLTTMGVKASTASEALAEPMWIIDPNGNLILQYPTDAEPEKVRKDISKLVYNSRIG
jgi:cytochrome oxidase Cu insertion factor (SCO1/SenC/PrrC family)